MAKKHLKNAQHHEISGDWGRAHESTSGHPFTCSGISIVKQIKRGNNKLCEDTEKPEPGSVFGGNGKWHSSCQTAQGSLKNLDRITTHVGQQFHF